MEGEVEWGVLNLSSTFQRMRERFAGGRSGWEEDGERPRGRPQELSLADRERQQRMEREYEIVTHGSSEQVLALYFTKLQLPSKSIEQLTLRDARAIQEFAEQSMVDTGRESFFEQRLLLIVLKRLLDVQGVPSTPGFEGLEADLLWRRERKSGQRPDRPLPPAGDDDMDD